MDTRKCSITIIRFLSGSLLSLFTFAHLVRADDSNQFFNFDSVPDIFTKDIRMEMPSLEVDKSEKSSTTKSNVTPQEAIKPLTKEDIIKKYGSPEIDHPLRVQNDAPASYKCFVEAYNIGEMELAQRCFEQYERYIDKLKTFNNTAMIFHENYERNRKSKLNSQEESVADTRKPGKISSLPYSHLRTHE